MKKIGLLPKPGRRKMKKIGLLPKLILAIIIGIGVGMLGMEVPIRVLATFNGIFGNFLKFSIPLIII